MFHGSLVALITPMLEDGHIDYAALERLTDWHLNRKTDGIIVLGTTGESATIEQKERKAIIEQVVAQAHQKVPVIVGTGTNATQHAIALTQQAMELGADAALLVTPYYNKPTQEGLYQHYKTIAQAVPLPQILYNVPARTACDLLPHTVKRLGKIPNIVALKEATPSLDRLQHLLKLECQVDLLSGDDGSAMEFVLAGGKGVISVAANVAPKLMHRLIQSALAGDREEAERQNNQLQPLFEGLFMESNPIPTKWVLSQMGLVAPGIRLPLTPLSAKHHAKLSALIHALEELQS